MKKTIFLFLLLTVGLTSIAQSRHFRDVVYLNDSSIIKGRIHFEEPDSTLFIDTPYGCTFAYTKDKVQRYQLESQMPFQRHKGFVLQSSISGGCFVFEDFFYGVSIGLLYQIGSLYSIGLDGDYHIVLEGSGRRFNTVHLDQRLYFSRKPISPYLNSKIGVSTHYTLCSNYYQYNNAVDHSIDWELGIGLSIKSIDVTACFGNASFSIYTVFSEGADYYGVLRLGYSLPIK